MNNLNELVEGLNKNQKKSVLCNDARMLVLAGAGTGKTRVLIHRIARHLIHDHFNSDEVLALTFTNKAAKEMSERTSKLVGEQRSRNLFTGTFHSFCARLLFRNHSLAGLSRRMQIMEPADQRSLMSDIVIGWEEEALKKAREKAKALMMGPDKKERYLLNVKTEFSALKKVIRPILDVIDSLKNEMTPRSQAISAFEKSPKIGSTYAKVAVMMFHQYEKHKDEHSLLDFNDLILKAISLLQNHEDFRLSLQGRFKAVLIDEFQDTNTAQDTLFHLLISPRTMVTVVGDEDQLIYSWRGAKIQNILEFDRKYNASVIMLEQNYRSTQTILTAANAVISSNKDRKGKKLWTENVKGELIELRIFPNAFQEADYVADRVDGLLDSGVSPSDIVLLYRNNFISSMLEKTLTQSRIKHILYGNVGFWGRMETKHVLYFLKWISHDNAQLAMKHVLGKAKVGYGDKTHVKLSKQANALGACLEDVLLEFADKGNKTENKRRLRETVLFVKEARSEFVANGLRSCVQMVVDKAGIKEYYRQLEKEHEVYLERYENIVSVLDLARSFKNDTLDDSELQQSDLEAFITGADLQVRAYEDRDVQNSISLMTIHASKGLEYPHVFLIGADEGIFPSKKNIDNDDLEEERRLCYVGLTRGMERVYITHSAERLQSSTIGLSRFIKEIPSELVDKEEVGRRAYF